MTDLAKIEDDIKTIADQIKSLKSSGTADNEAIKSAVTQLLAAKKAYAENNNGIGVDGKPYHEPNDKAQQKTKEKSDSDGGAKQVCCSCTHCLIQFVTSRPLLCYLSF